MSTNKWSKCPITPTSESLSDSEIGFLWNLRLYPLFLYTKRSGNLNGHISETLGGGGGGGGGVTTYI